MGLSPTHTSLWSAQGPFFFFKQPYVKQVLCTELSRAVCICEVDDDGDVPLKLIRSVVIGENPPLFTSGILCVGIHYGGDSTFMKLFLYNSSK